MTQLPQRLVAGVMAIGAGVLISAVAFAIAAGAILAMLVDTMIPEATQSTHDYSGLIAVVGFLTAFVLSKAGG